LVDTGSNISAISTKLAKKHNLPIQCNTSIHIKQVNGKFKTVGRSTLNITIGGITNKVNFHVLNDFAHDMLLGLDACDTFDLHVHPRSRKVYRFAQPTNISQSNNPIQQTPISCNIAETQVIKPKSQPVNQNSTLIGTRH